MWSSYARHFEFTFRVQLAGDVNYTWLGGYGRDGAVTVSPPGADDAWTEGPNYDLIYGSVYCENVIAACRAKRLGFAHVLNMADNLDVIYQPAVEVIYKKVDAKDGGYNGFWVPC